jgi:hypothetical protein
MDGKRVQELQGWFGSLPRTEQLEVLRFVYGPALLTEGLYAGPPPGIVKLGGLYCGPAPSTVGVSSQQGTCRTCGKPL